METYTFIYKKNYCDSCETIHFSSELFLCVTDRVYEQLAFIDQNRVILYNIFRYVVSYIIRTRYFISMLFFSDSNLLYSIRRKQRMLDIFPAEHVWLSTYRFYSRYILLHMQRSCSPVLYVI